MSPAQLSVRSDEANRTPSGLVASWHDQPFDAVRRALDSSDSGLTNTEARKRLDEVGANRLKEAPRPGALKVFSQQFKDVTVLSLLVAAGVALGLGAGQEGTALSRFGDAIAILAIVVINATIGFVQERRAEAALQALRDLTAPTARVRRDGVEQTLSAQEVVPGDLVLLDEGDRVPADLRLSNATHLTVNESVLTGESFPADKATAEVLAAETPLAERRNMVFLGTHVATGRGAGTVVATGMETELGRVAALMSTIHSGETPLQADLRRFGLRLVVACLIVAAIVFVVGMLRGQATLAVLLMTAISLAVAAIPEGLPAVTTIVLALGVQRMARRNALVRKLSAVETLGSADVICTDKTGTLTENRMTVRMLATADSAVTVVPSDDGLSLVQGDTEANLDEHFALRELIRACRLPRGAKLTVSGTSVSASGEPTDAALLLLAHQFGFAPEPRVAFEIPFARERHMATVGSEEDGEVVEFHHGVPEELVSRATRVLRNGARTTPIDAAIRDHLTRIIEDWSARGLRVVAVARDEAHAPTLIGLVALNDPPRVEIIDAVRKATAAGVRTIMITGDHPRTAQAIAKEVGLAARHVVAAPALDELSDDMLAAEAERIDIVARATAAHKLRFVRALLSRNHVVAMTGDGVNDAPALRAATIGVAMGRVGTDVAREAADIVLSDDNYSTIVAAIEEGRIIVSNIRRFILFLLSINAGLVFAVFAAALLGWESLLTPSQILWINLVTNGLPALALGVESVHVDPMTRGPRRAERIVSGKDVPWILAFGGFMALIGLLVFFVFRSEDVGRARTMAFTVLALAPVFHAFTCRSRNRSIFSMGLLSNRPLLAAGVVAITLQAAALYLPGFTDVFRVQPLPPSLAFLALGIALTTLLVGEVEKLFRNVMNSSGKRRGDRGVQRLRTS